LGREIVHHYPVAGYPEVEFQFAPAQCAYQARIWVSFQLLAVATWRSRLRTWHLS
jgi:hypothetical protein